MINNRDTTSPTNYCPDCRAWTIHDTKTTVCGGIKWACCRCGRWDYQREAPATPGEG